jgi:hypothetical protein
MRGFSCTTTGTVFLNLLRVGKSGYSTRVSVRLLNPNESSVDPEWLYTDLTQYIPVSLFDLQSWLGRSVHGQVRFVGLRI